MTPAQAKKAQQALLEAGYYTGKIDGIWGPLSQAAHEAALSNAARQRECTMPEEVEVVVRDDDALPWSGKVSDTFIDRVEWIAKELNMPAEGAGWLMACMAFESAETFESNIYNGAGSGAVGLIQFMPSTARSLGTNVRSLARMTPEDQLNYVYKYFRPYKNRLNSLSDVYMAILWPIAIGKDDDHVLWSADSRPTTYRQNAGLDLDGDYTITKGEATAKVQEKLDRGWEYLA